MVLVVATGSAGCRRSRDRSSTSARATTTSTAAAPAGADAAAGCATPVPPPGQRASAFEFQGQSRTYQLFVPQHYDGRHPVPVVFNFHGFGSNAQQQMFYGDFRAQADRDTFLVVAPDGQGQNRHFNLTGESGLQDDVAMVLALLDHVESTLCVDADRVFSTGMSDGGAMTSALACKAPDRFAAFGAVAVIIFQEACAGTRPVAITAFAGTADPVVPFNGGVVSCCGHPTLGSAPGAMAGWAKHDGCAAAPREDRLGSEVRRQTWPDCRGGSAVVFYIVDGGGHTWPGAVAIPSLGLTTQQVRASDAIWDFFKAHPLVH